LAVVLPVYFSLRKTQLWLPWLTLASYFFYGWWNPYYLSLVIYSTFLDFGLVALMDHCPRERTKIDLKHRLFRLQFGDRVLKTAFLGAAIGALILLATALIGPPHVRPTLLVGSVLVFLMALGALFSSRRIWLWISLINNLALLLFFKYGRFVIENLNAVLTGLHVRIVARPIEFYAVRVDLPAAGGHLVFQPFNR